MLYQYLTLGDMLTFFGLILAVIGLIKPWYMLVWSLTNKFIKYTAVSFLAIGYFLPLASVLIHDTKHAVFDGLTLDHLLQVIGFIAITLGLLIGAYLYTHFNYSHLIKNKTIYKFNFNKYPKNKWTVLNLQIERTRLATTRSAEKFWHVTSEFLARGYIQEVVEVTRVNLKPLVYSALKYYPALPNNLTGQEDKKSPSPNGTNYTFETLYRILTDETVMKHICTKNRFFLHRITDLEVKLGKAYQSELARVLYPNIVKHLVLNQDSFLYTEKDKHNGIARVANVYDMLANDDIVRRQIIIPSQLTWYVSKTDIPLDAYADVISRLLQPIIESYKKQPNNKVLQNIRAILDVLMGDLGSLVSIIAGDRKARRRYADDITNSVEANIIRTIHLNIINDFFKDSDPDSFKNNTKEIKAENKKNIFEQDTFTGLVAQEVYELIESLTILFENVTEPDENMRQVLVEYLLLNRTNSQVYDRYKDLIFERLFDKAVYGKFDNASNIQGYYPNVLRHLIGLLASLNHIDNFESQAQTKLKSIMAKELKDAILNETKMHDKEETPVQEALLPSNIKVKINKREKEVKYYLFDNRGNKELIDLSLGNNKLEKIVKKSGKKDYKLSKKAL